MPSLISILLLLLLSQDVIAAELPSDGPLHEIIVTSSRRPERLVDYNGSLQRLGNVAIADDKHTHIHELLTRVAGVWISRGSGQESLPSIRSPVLTGAGSCGSFLTLEDSIPTRPTGFCNVNQLFEIPTELASSVEVIRGPANALYGSNALHGTINVLMPGADTELPSHAGIELGPNNFARIDASVGLLDVHPIRLGLVATHDGGFRQESGYEQLKTFVRYSTNVASATLNLGFSSSNLDQETAGFILGKDAYKDRSINRGNPNPEAFRTADSRRFFAHWIIPTRHFDLDMRQFVRKSDMEFLQHFLPGQPLETNGQTSAGMLTSATFARDSVSYSVGLDVEWSDSYLTQNQIGPTEGSDFLQETRPQGQHYDYEVTGFTLALYAQLSIQLNDRTDISIGLRGENTRYDYDNKMLDGNTRDDGTACGFGGCLYTRPADREDSFSNVAPKVGLNLSLSPSTTLYTNLSRGFRAPQMSELYRLQNGQLISDLKSERMDSLDVGVRYTNNRWFVDSSVFAMRKENSVLRDAEGFNVSAAASRHVGVEFRADWHLHDQWLLRINGTYARHTYDFDLVAARGEQFVSGRDIDTAPRLLGSVEANFDFNESTSIAAQWVSIGRYYLDAENQHEYPGHSLINIRGTTRFSARGSITVRLKNLLDRQVADRADFAFGNYRYFPARGREVFAEIRFEFE